MGSWRKFFKSNADLLEDIMKYIRVQPKVYPPVDSIFEMFNEINPRDIRVLIVGQSPYPNRDACGIPFMSKFGTNTKSLENIAKELKQEYPHLSLPRNYNRIISGWVKQGVFMINAAMTVGPGDDYMSDHSVIWHEFTQELIRYITSKVSIPVILMGSTAWALDSSVVVSNGCKIIKVPHPVGFIGCDVFLKCNTYLPEDPIMWLSF
jgi:uracil-DNA glycosylase